MRDRDDHYRLDDLRRFGVDLASRLGVDPARASSFVSSLLWYDAAAAAIFGIACLPDWLDAIARGEVDPKSGGTIRRETTATAVLDGETGIGPLILARAGQVAQEKAREVGVGVVRVEGLGRVGPSADVAAAIALGPMIGTVLGPGSSWSTAVPVAETVPAAFDTALGGAGPGPPPWSIGTLPAWTFPFGAEGGWAVVAASVGAFEPLAAFHARVDGLLKGASPTAGEVRPEAWRAGRDDHLARGLALPRPALDALKAAGDRLGVAWPGPIGR